MAKSAKSGRAPAAATIDDPAKTNTIIVGKSTKYEVLDLHFANRHGLVAGATGTGKTVTLQVLAEGLSEAGVPVFAADIKGDLSGIAAAGEMKDALVARAKSMGLTYQPDQCPVVFWDVFGEQGHPDPRDHFRDGAAAAVAALAAQRHARRRSQYRVPRRR